MAAQSINPEHLLAGRVLGLDRSALPALASRAALRAGGLSLEQLRAGFDDERDTPRSKIRRVGATAIIPIVGLISSDAFLTWLFGGTSPDAIAAAVRQAVADSEVRDIVLIVGSPGGEVSLVPEAAAEIRRCRAIKPITAMARPLAASAAYWLACSATSVVATPSADVGSCGVYWAHVDVSKMDDRVGVAVTYIANDPKKVELNPHQPLEEGAHAFMQARVDTVYGSFVRDMAAGRRVSESHVRAKFGSGRCFSAAEALARGLVDRIATLEEILQSPGAGRTSRSVASAHDAEDRLLMAAALIALD